MRKLNLIVLLSISCVSFIGCQPQNRTLNMGNFAQKFDQAEQAILQQPSKLTQADLESVLGPSRQLDRTDPQVSDLPPGALPLELNWVRWSYHNETFLAGMSEGKVVQSNRIRR